MVKPRDNRIPIMFSEEELGAIDDWRFANRIATRADAVRRLCKIGLFADNELEQIVDVAKDGVETLTEQAELLSDVHQALLNPKTEDLVFGPDEVRDILRMAHEHADVAEQGMIGLHLMIVTLYNVVAAIVDARTIRSGQREADKRIADATAAVERLEEKQAEREENRYIGIIATNETPEEHAAWTRLPDDEQEAYIKNQIEAMKAEEAKDPEGFAKRYNISPPFWHEAGWETRLRQREKMRYMVL